MNKLNINNNVFNEYAKQNLLNLKNYNLIDFSMNDETLDDFVDFNIDDKYNKEHDFIKNIFHKSFNEYVKYAKRDNNNDIDYLKYSYVNALNNDNRVSNVFTKYAHLLNMINENDKILYVQNSFSTLTFHSYYLYNSDDYQFANVNFDNSTFNNETQKLYINKQKQNSTHHLNYFVLHDNNVFKLDDSVSTLLTNVIYADMTNDDTNNVLQNLTQFIINE